MAKFLRAPNRCCLAFAVVISLLLVSLSVIDSSATETGTSAVIPAPILPQATAAATGAETNTSLLVTPEEATTGTVVTMTATVTQNSAFVTGGRVSFFDIYRLLGTVDVVGDKPAPGFTTGTATLKTRLGQGSHYLTAVFSGQAGVLSPSSSSEQAVWVSGTQLTKTTLVASADKKLITTVLGFGWTEPDGMITFTDTTTGAELDYDDYDLLDYSFVETFGEPLNSVFTAGPGQLAVGDFNRDGWPDLVVGIPGNKTLNLLLGKGDGTFYPPRTYNLSHYPWGLVAADFNRDGALDVAVGGEGTLSVFLGDPGTGLLNAPIVTFVGGDVQLATGDVNNDGLLDLVASSSANGTVDLLLGQGDGTFQPGDTYSVAPYLEAPVLADFNGDAMLDVVVADDYGIVHVLLSDPQNPGHFLIGPTYAIGIHPAIVAADLNGDGVVDLAVGSYNVDVLLGTGDGTFQPRQTYLTSSTYHWLVVADFNGDRIPDLAVTRGDVTANVVGLLLGNGDGTFQTRQATGVPGSAPQYIVTADFNGDGLPDLAISNYANNSVSVLLRANQLTMTAANVQVCGTGTHQLRANFIANYPDQYSDSMSSTVSLPAGRVNSNIYLVPQPGTYGEPIALVAILGKVGCAPEATGTFSYQVDGGLAQSAQLSNGSASLPLGVLHAGSHNVSVSYSGDESYLPGGPQAVSVSVGKAPLTVAADNKTMIFGSTAPALTGVITGAVNNDVINATYTTAATSASPVGTYDIVPSVGGTALSNYTVTSIKGTLSITPATPVVTVTCLPVNYDGHPHSCTAAAKGIDGAGVSGSLTLSYAQNGVPVTNPTAMGSYVVNAAFTSADGNYTNAMGSGTLTIAGWVSVSPLSLSFPEVTLPNGSSSQYVTVTNYTGQTLAFGDITASANFVVSYNFCGAPLAVNTSCKIYVRFTPSTTGTLTGTLTINETSPAGTQTVALSGTALSGGVTVSSASLSFPEVTLPNSSSSQYVTITNDTGQTITFGDISASANFLVSYNACGSSLAYRSSCMVYVRFTPTTAGALAGTLTINETSPTGAQTVALSGTALSGGVTVSSTSLSFPEVTLPNGSSSQYVTITNDTGQTITFGDISASANFLVSYNVCGSSLAYRSSCKVYVRFTPTTAGALTGTLTINETSPAGSQTVALAGNAVSGGMQVSAASLSFPEVTIPNGSSSQYVTVTNYTGQTITFGDINTSANFMVSYNVCGASLAYKANCKVYVRFTPSASGPLTGVLTINETSPAGTQTVSLSGTGVGRVVLSTSSLDFGTVPAATGSSSQMMTVTNYTGAPLSMSAPITDAGFVVSYNSCGSVLAAGGSCGIWVRVVPGSIGPVSGNLYINDSWGTGVQTVALTATLN